MLIYNFYYICVKRRPHNNSLNSLVFMKINFVLRRTKIDYYCKEFYLQCYIFGYCGQIHMSNLCIVQEFVFSYDNTARLSLVPLNALSWSQYLNKFV